MFKRLVTYGCSFTAGDELCDHELIPISDNFKRLHGMNKFNEMMWKTVDREKIDTMYAKQRQVAYPGILSRKLGID